MVALHVMIAWVGIFLGFVSGAVMGLFFRQPDWLGGYASWARRMVRLGHISFFGMACVNFAYALTIIVGPLKAAPVLPWASGLLVAGAVGMPLFCFLAAWRAYFRHLFFIPVLCLLVSAGAVLICLCAA